MSGAETFGLAVGFEKNQAPTLNVLRYLTEPEHSRARSVMLPRILFLICIFKLVRVHGITNVSVPCSDTRIM
jgi:hypothetical protein